MLKVGHRPERNRPLASNKRNLLPRVIKQILVDPALKTTFLSEVGNEQKLRAMITNNKDKIWKTNVNSKYFVRTTTWVKNSQILFYL